MTVTFRDSDGTTRLAGDLLASGGATGDVLTQQADGTYAAAAGGSLPDPLTTPINLETTDTSKVPLKITLPEDFDLGAYDAIEIEDFDGLRLLSFDVGGNMLVTANPTLGVPSSAFLTDGSTARITLQQGSDANDTQLIARPGTGKSAAVEIQNANGSREHQLSSGATVGTGNAGFYGKTPVALQTGVAVNAGAIHAALVNLGLITA